MRLYSVMLTLKFHLSKAEYKFEIPTIILLKIYFCEKIYSCLGETSAQPENEVRTYILKKVFNKQYRQSKVMHFLIIALLKAMLRPHFW